MSSKLDQGLDDIISTNRTGRRGRGRGGRRVVSKATTAAPVGGVQKKTRAAGVTARKAAVPNGPIVPQGSKVMVSNLPSDVSEQQIKEYFSKSVGPVKRAHITYGPNGISRGIATVVFGEPSGANQALKKLNGVLVDKRPMKIEVILDATRVPAAAPIKGLSERIGQPNNAKPKSAAPKSSGPKPVTKAPRGRGRPRGGRAARGKPKTADELDAEMVDYFDATAANGVSDGLPPPAIEEAMDEIS